MKFNIELEVTVDADSNILPVDGQFSEAIRDEIDNALGFIDGLSVDQLVVGMVVERD